jgi:hypothetical protein
VDPRPGLDDVEKRKFLTLPGLELDSSVVQPVVSRYIDYSVPAPIITIIILIAAACGLFYVAVRISIYIALNGRTVE